MLTWRQCKAVDEEAAESWQAHLANDPREDEASFVVVFSPARAERDFGFERFSDDSGL